MLKQRHLVMNYGFNQRHLRKLIEEGILKTLPTEGKRKVPLIDPDSFDSLLEGDHYIPCKECGARLAQVTTKHLKGCSELTMDSYFKKHNGAPIMCAFTKENKKKSEEQKARQSETLKARFKTPQGEVTREQIRQASIKMQQSEVGDRIKDALRETNKNQVSLAKKSKKSKAMWGTKSHQDKIQMWQKENRQQVLESCKNAREHISHTFTKPHQTLKQVLVSEGIETLTEHTVSYYHIDEAIPTLKIAIEVDGCYWHGCGTCGFTPTRRIAGNDKAKDTNLSKLGWVVLRLKEHEIYENPSSCLERIKTLVQQRST
jgi:DNA mismatch endonuclease (patch repair protein)